MNRHRVRASPPPSGHGCAPVAGAVDVRDRGAQRLVRRRFSPPVGGGDASLDLRGALLLVGVRDRDGDQGALSTGPMRRW